ncbi:MAG: L-mandelate dehydrogenase [Microgenomates group bacterium GW2011_GWB1_40_9]|nr:MAG: L-mandelate dehydrogenase [Microgenomates group bacterium GW2011_GWC1_39_12]KKR79892.1 MAG: L-mandelate dehydrogenase [Microgenomates group bacterium GW2011_GWB1_40_9]
MKKELVISFLIVIVVIGGIFWSLQKKPTVPATSQIASVEPTTQPAVTKQEVMKHNTKDDCWVIVSGSVYNVTSYIPNHKGGPDKIISVCGQDATTLFTTRNGKGPHPDKVQGALNAMLVGPLAK